MFRDNIALIESLNPGQMNKQKVTLKLDNKGKVLIIHIYTKMERKSYAGGVLFKNMSRVDVDIKCRWQHGTRLAHKSFNRARGMFTEAYYYDSIGWTQLSTDNPINE